MENSASLFLLMLLAALGLFVGSLAEKVAAERVLSMLPASARGSFLLYQLATAINSEDYPWLELELEQEQELLVAPDMDSSWLAAMANEFQNLPVPESFPMDFQSWLVESYGVSAMDVYQQWHRKRSTDSAQQICNAVGQCFEVAQMIAACCPF